jgi:hypothetical protein
MLSLMVRPHRQPVFRCYWCIKGVLPLAGADGTHAELDDTSSLSANFSMLLVRQSRPPTGKSWMDARCA